jgi:hypothetical protein
MTFNDLKPAHPTTTNFTNCNRWMNRWSKQNLTRHGSLMKKTRVKMCATKNSEVAAKRSERNEHIGDTGTLGSDKNSSETTRQARRIRSRESGGFQPALLESI